MRVHRETGNLVISDGEYREVAVLLSAATDGRNTDEIPCGICVLERVRDIKKYGKEKSEIKGDHNAHIDEELSGPLHARCIQQAAAYQESHSKLLPQTLVQSETYHEEYSILRLV